MSDTHTTIAQLRSLVAQFVHERDWAQFHAPKNLSMALAIEAAELMEHFQWLSVEDSRNLRRDSNDVQGVREELADVMTYALALANAMQIDLSDAIREKLEKNAEKYPAESYRGRYR